MIIRISLRHIAIFNLLTSRALTRIWHLLTPMTIYGGWLYYKYQDFANSINTACYTYGWIDDINTANAGVYSIQIWGTEDGIFQNNRNYSYTLDWPHKQYLKGINVNKVTSILGL